MNRSIIRSDAGHRSWSKIKPSKGAPDVKRRSASYQLSKALTVAYRLHNKGILSIPTGATGEGRMLELVMGASAKNCVHQERFHVISSPANQRCATPDSRKNADLLAESLKLNYIPANSIAATNESPQSDHPTQVLRLCAALHECDEVQSSYANFDIPEELLANLSI